MEGSELLQTFERELRQSTTQMQTLLLEVEEKENFAEALPLLQEAYRLSHSLKGASRVVGLFPVEQIAHALEDQLQRLLRDELPPTSSEISVFLQVQDAFVEAFESFLRGELFESGPIENELRSLEQSHAEEEPIETLEGSVIVVEPSHELQEPSFRREEQVSVPSKHIDELFRRMEESFLIESRISTLLASTDTLFQETSRGQIPDIWHRQYAQLKNEAMRLHVVLMHFHDIVRSFRMVPMKRLKIAAQKAVRDLAITLGKPVSFRFYGEHQMLDASVLEALHEPVLHLIRNAVDHGIEVPEERLAALKSAEGLIEAHATITGGFLNLTLTDDGRGIDSENIRRKAIELQLVSNEESAQLKDTEWIEFLFRPGFSTSESVSAISGRGLGMEIVRRRILDLGGHLQTETRVGFGTTFTIQVPIGLLTPRVLLVRSGEHQAALHISDIERVFGYDPSAAREINGTTMIEWNHMPIPLESLASHLGWYSPRPGAHVILLNRQGIRKALLVDSIVAEIEQVAFPPPWNLRGLPYLSGVIVMGDGSLVPVIESQDLMKKMEESKVVPAADVAAVAPFRTRSVLVVDDSPTMVALHRSILKNAGYRVLTADNGRSAWEVLQSQTVELLLTDIEMPEMNGVELIRRVRTDSSRKNLPIIVISQYGAREDLQKAANAGADRYIVKSSFRPQQLLETVQELLME